jgi:hypothetical protein
MPRRALAMLIGTALLLLPAVPRADEKVKDDKGKELKAKQEDKVKDDKPNDDKPADEAAPAGTWKITLPTLRGAGTDPVWLVKLQKKDDKWSGEVVATKSRWPKAKLEKLKVAADQVRFDLKTAELPPLACAVTLPKGAKAARLRGTYTLNRRPQPIELERTALKSLEAGDVLKERLAKQEDGADAVLLALPLLSQAEANKATAADVRSWAEKAARSAGLYGVGWQRDILLIVSEVLAEQKGYEAVALQYARRAERLLTAKDPVGEQQRVLEALADVLEKAGKEEDAKTIRAKVKKLDIRVKAKPFAGRKGKSQRVALVELFTSAQVPPTVAADLAFDALGRTFKPTEVVLLQYHMNLPRQRSDALASPASEARAEFYEKVVEGAPTLLINGKAGPEGGGGIDDATDKYDEYVKALTPVLETAEKAELKLGATRKGAKVTINAEVAKLAQTGDDVRLRVALVERDVSYKAGNGLSLFYHVVRDMPGGDAGTVMKEKAAKKTFTVDVDALKKKINSYLDKQGEKAPFPDKSRPLELKNLRVIAFVQNDKSGEVLQAVQAEVKGE